MGKPMICLVNASIRGRSFQDEICNIPATYTDERQFKEHLERVLREKKVCNTERGLMTTAFGIGQRAEMKYLRLNQWFLKDGTIRASDEVIKKLQEADGIIFGTPVYFGDCTSLLYDLLRICKESKINLFRKVVGFMVVGAKRNGGQETTVVSSAWDVMALGACVINDGDPVSQFGGTCVAGNIGATASNDDFGIETCIGLGKRIAETAQILQLGDDDGIAEIDIWDIPEILKEYKLHRCRACEVCPHYKEGDYRCINRDDDMKDLHEKLVSSDGIIPKGFDMRFFERTRYLRRDNYRLTYQVVRLSNIRYLPIFIKENSILCRKHLVAYASLIKSGRKLMATKTPEYKAIGY